MSTTLKQIRDTYKALRVGQQLRLDAVDNQNMRVIGVGTKWIRCMGFGGRIVRVKPENVIDWWRV
jgi:hypothetical protein